MLPEKKNKTEFMPKLIFLTLGRFEIRKDNTDAYIPSSRSTKLWDLFKFLLANKKIGMPPEIILENLYPNESYENPKNTLQNLVYRLRKLLSDENIFSDYNCNILFTNGCYSLDFSGDICLDTDIFELYLQKTIDYYEEAIALYRGDYFPELVYEDWVIPKRNYYRRLYTQAVNELSDIYKQKKAFDDSIRICEKAIQIEPYEEDFNISFMESLIGKGKINEARKHYGYITGLLYKQFGIKPTPEMQNIYHMLKNDTNKGKENSINIDFEENDNRNGAFYCNPNTFRSLFIIEKRRNERTNDSVLPVSFSIDECDNNKTVIFDDFRRFLVKSLRKGDVVTTWKNSQLLVLLPKIDNKGIRVISDRIIKQFQCNENHSDIEIKVSVHPFLP